MKNVTGSERNRKGETSESTSDREAAQEFGKKVVERYGNEWFECHRK